MKFEHIYIALIMTVLMFIANILFWQLYLTIVSTVVFAYGMAFLALLFLTKQYIERSIKPIMFYIGKYLILPLLLEVGLSYAAFNALSAQNRQATLNNEMSVKISQNQSDMSKIVDKHNQLIGELRNIEPIIAGNCQNQSHARKMREEERLMAFVNTVNDVSIQDNHYSVSELSTPNNLSCSKTFVQAKIKQVNALRSNFIKMAGEQEQLHYKQQLLQENNKNVKNNNQEFASFLKKYGLIMIFSMILNVIFNIIGVKQKLNMQIFKNAQNDAVLPREVMLSKLVPYVSPTSFVENSWRSWIQPNLRYKIYGKRRIIKLDCNNPIDVEIMNHLHSPNIILDAKLLSEKEMKKWYELDLLDDDIFSNQYRFYEFQTKILNFNMFDYYFAYKNCLK